MISIYSTDVVVGSRHCREAPLLCSTLLQRSAPLLLERVIHHYCATAAHDQSHCVSSLTAAIRDFDGVLIQSLVDLHIHAGRQHKVTTTTT